MPITLPYRFLLIYARTVWNIVHTNLKLSVLRMRIHFMKHFYNVFYKI